VPEFKALQVPRVGVKAAVLVQDANAVAEAAKPFHDVFVGNGRPATVVDDLVAASGGRQSRGPSSCFAPTTPDPRGQSLDSH
jgi:hypothetical protein